MLGARMAIMCLHLALPEERDSAIVGRSLAAVELPCYRTRIGKSGMVVICRK